MQCICIYSTRPEYLTAPRRRRGQCFFSMGLTATLWFAFGFGLAFGETVGGVVGSAASFPLLLNMDPCTPAGYPMAAGLHVPAFLFAGYQMMFGARTKEGAKRSEDERR